MISLSARSTQFKVPLLVVTMLLFLPVMAFACKYSVRDVGFVTLDKKYYELRLITSSDLKQEQRTTQQQKIASLLRDTNILVSMLPVDSAQVTQSERHQFEASQTTVAFLSDSFPNPASTPNSNPDSAANSNPDSAANNETPEQSPLRELFLQEIDLDDQEAVSSMIWELSQSTLRERILFTSLKAHSVLLVVEGNNEKANQKAIQLAKNTSQLIKETLPDLPKMIEHPPEILIIPITERPEERILLWSLGCPLKENDSAYILPLFGRGRMLGEPLTVPGLSSTELTTILGYVGQDCECELDRSWMQGKMFPHRWEEDIQEQAAKTLEFDPGNPLVMTEITRILARGPNVRRNLQAGEVAATDLIDLNQESEDEVSKETADDILRELNLLPESPTSETNSLSGNSIQPTAPAGRPGSPLEINRDENIVVDSVSIPIGNNTYLTDFYISKSIVVVFELITVVLILGLVWFLLRHRRR